MNDFGFEYIKIGNFKSIKDLYLQCRKINIFIGLPNVGKSNIIEALSLLDKSTTNSSYNIKKHIRFNNPNDMFYMKNSSKPILVETDKSFSIFLKHIDNGYQSFKHINSKNSGLIDLQKFLSQGLRYYNETIVNLGLNLTNTTNSNDISTFILGDDFNAPSKNYKFVKSGKFDKYSNFVELETPNGENLFQILFELGEVRELLSEYLRQQDLKLVYVEETNSFIIQTEAENQLTVVQTSFQLLADTLQRIIFYLCAVQSNSNSVLLFEEPEVNSFPDFIKVLANFVSDSANNQFFIATHSPYLLTSLLENSFDDVALNIVSLNNNETVVRQLSEKEKEELLLYDSDIFLNIQRYVENE